MSERDFHDHHYEHDAEHIFEGALFRRVHARGAREFLRAIGGGAGKRILSLGCGDGSIERRLAPQVGEIVGVDISGVAIALAADKARAAGLSNLAFHALDPSRGMAGLGRFDAVAAFAFLHHLDDAAIGATQRDARQALKPGGAFYSADPSHRRLVRLFAGLVRGSYDKYHSPDERELDAQALAAAAAQAGLLQPVIRYTDYFLGPLAWLAPGAPRWTAAPLEALDNLALALPFVRRYASSFSLVARAP